MNLLDKFYSSFMQEIVSRQLANEDGETQEQAFTRYVLDLLSEAGETENAAVAFDEKAMGTSKQHKINVLQYLTIMKPLICSYLSMKSKSKYIQFRKVKLQEPQLVLQIFLEKLFMMIMLMK